MRCLPNNNAIAREFCGRYGQDPGVKDEICVLRRTVWHQRGEISEDSI